MPNFPFIGSDLQIDRLTQLGLATGRFCPKIGKLGLATQGEAWLFNSPF